MTWAEAITAGLARSDIETVAYLPDSVLAPLIDTIETHGSFEMLPVAREEEAVGVLSGAWFGGRRGALLCQTSGLANTFNALGSLSKPDGIPFLGLITRRGDLSDHNLAQAPAGYAMPRLLDDIGIRNHKLESEADVADVVTMASKTAFHQQEPYALFLEPTLTGGK